MWKKWMRKKTMTEKHIWKTYLILTGTFLFLLLLNCLMPLRGDDYDYSLVWGTARHVSSLEDVFQSAYNHYLTHGGRMVTVFFLDLFLWAGKLPFDIANAAIFTGVLILLYCHSTRDIKLTAEPGLLATAALFMWLCLPHFGEVAVWKSGSTVYLWSGFFALLFLLPYNLFLAGRLQWKAGMAIPMFLLGILGGWSVENLAVTVVMLSVGITWYARKQRRLQIWLPAGAAGAVIGFIGILAAPGNYVRYDEQGAGESFLRHIGNQFAGNGEMLLYLIPAILLFLLIWRLLKLQMLTDGKGRWNTGRLHFGMAQGVIIALILLLIISYFEDGFIGKSICDLLITGVLTPLHLDRPKTIYQITHVMQGFEEMAIYWASIFFIYFQSTKALGLTKIMVRTLNRKFSARDVWQAYPEIHYSGALIFLCFLNNFWIIAAPTFPARATFSSSLMFMAAVLAALRIPEIKQMLQEDARKILCIGGSAVGVFIAAATIMISSTVQQQHNQRVAYIAAQAGSGAIVHVPPIEVKSLALRHFFYKEFQEGRRLNGLMWKYFGVRKIVYEGETRYYTTQE